MRDELSCGPSKIYFAAVCRCFPGKNSAGGDRVPAPDEIHNCAAWMNNEIEILQPRLIIPVGRLAISQFIDFEKLEKVVGRKFRVRRPGQRFDLIPFPHPSGASPWHRIAPGKELLGTRAKTDRASFNCRGESGEQALDDCRELLGLI